MFSSSRRLGRALPFIALVSGALLLSSCVAEFVDRQKPRKGPVKEVGYIENAPGVAGSGEIRYSMDGWGWVISLRRRTALRRIRSVCKDLPVNILDEYTHDDADTPYSGNEISDISKGVEVFQVSPYHHIHFECSTKPGDKKP